MELDSEEMDPPVPAVGTEEYREALRESLRHKRKPTTMQVYNTEEAAIWQHRHIPPGSVITFKASPEDGSEDQEVAVLVTSYLSGADGIWLGVSVVGAESDGLKKTMQAYFKGGRRSVHICLPDPSGSCPVGEEMGTHLTTFTWYPPGDFAAPWVNAYGMKKVKDGPMMAAEAAKEARPGAGGRPPRTEGPELSETEKRLQKLKDTRRRVSFGGAAPAKGRHRPGDGDLDGSPTGILKKGTPSGSAPPPSLAIADRVKKEAIDLVSDCESGSRREKRKAKRRQNDALAVAAASHRLQELKKETRSDRERSRSRKKSKRKRGKKRDRSSSNSSSGSSGSTSSSLLPPLKRKSNRRPGSVLRMLEHQAFEFLQQDGVVGEHEENGDGPTRPKLYTYYQLALRPGLDPKSRDSKELALLCKGLDLLRAGNLEVLADLLAARLIAVETATRQGWATARHLEIHTGEDEETAPAHLLLAAHLEDLTIHKGQLYLQMALLLR